MSSGHDQFGPPGPDYLAVHAAIGNILNLTARGEAIQKLIHDYDDCPLLATDGSTNLGALLSVSKLSLLATRTAPSNVPLVKPRAPARNTTLPGSENIKPSSLDSEYFYEQ
jgi:hypothetical protein